MSKRGEAMSEVFISYARGEAGIAASVAEALRAEGYEVWRDDELPPHRPFAEVIEERIDAAKAVLVLWSPEAVKSQWVRSEADRARGQAKLVQAMLAPVRLPMPFDQIQCEDLSGWPAGAASGAWRKLLASVAEISGRAPAGTAPVRPIPTGPSTWQPPVVAVAPFASAEAEQPIAEGVTDEVVRALARFPQFRVIAGEAARQGGARFVLEGVVRRAGGQLRLSIKLTDTGDGAQLWAERVDGAADDAFDLQDRAAAAVAAGVVGTVYTAETQHALALPTDQLSAYQLYLRAMHLERAFTREAMEEGVQLLDRAADLDPGFGPGLAANALMRSLLVLNGWAGDQAETSGQALELARRALASANLDPDSLATVATVFIWLGEDPAGSDAMIARAMAQNPGAALPRFAAGWVKLFAGEPELAIHHFEQHLAVDTRTTLQPFVAGGVGVALALLRRFGEAVPQLREALRAVPDQRPFRAALVVCLAYLGERAEAADMLAALPDAARTNFLRLFRRPADRALMREGLALAARSRSRSRGAGRPAVSYGRRR